MSSDNASSTVTYTSVSSDSNGPLSWGILLMNADKIPNMDPYEEVAQQGQALPLSPAYVPNPMELDEHVPVYVPEPEHPKYHVPSDDDIQIEDQPYAKDASPTAELPGYHADSDSIEDDTDTDSTDYPDEPGTDDEEPKEEPSEERDPEEEDKPSEDYDKTEPFEENEDAATPPPPGHRRERISVRPQPYMAASTEALIDAFATRLPSFPLPPTSPAYDQAPLAESYDVAAARAPRGQYNSIDVVEARQGLIRSPGHDTQTIARAADRAEDVGYVRALQASKHRMMTSIEETDRKNIRLEIDVVRGQRTAYETELHEVRQAYLSSKARNRTLLAQLETLETHMSRMEWQHQRVEDDAVRQIMHTQVLEARARIDTVEDAGIIIIISICIDIVIISHVHCILVIIRIMPVTRQGTNDAMTPESIQAMIDWPIQRNSTQNDESQSSGGGIKRPVQPAS
ncbi:hypothetical protein Tco_0584533 [Tanacetum coccineum]